MGLIQSSVLLGIADRCAYQYGVIAENWDSINVTGGGYYFQRVTATDDPDVEIPLLNTYYLLDTEGFNLENMIKSGLPKLLTVVTAMDAHFSRVGHTGGWDSYLNADAERVSDYFNMVYHAAKSVYMLANNVFSEDENVFGTFTGAPVFTDGVDYGDGSWENYADGSQFAPTQLSIVVETGATASNLVVTLNVKNAQNQPTTVQNSVPLNGGVGTSVDMGTANDRFLDVTGVVIDSGSLAGGNVKIINKVERAVAP